MTTPDTSPGDELSVILETWLDDAMGASLLAIGASGYKGSEANMEERRVQDYNVALGKAKDRLNRLMLTRERERLEKLLPKFVHVLPNGVEAYVSSIEAEEVIKKELAAIDAQINKEEK